MLRVPPAPFDPARAARILEALAEKGFVPPPQQRALLEGVFGNSPYLGRLGLRESETLSAVLQEGAVPALARARAQALGAADAANEAAAMTQLRIAKRRAALAIALADIAGDFDLLAVTQALSDFADAAVKGALRFQLRQLALRDGRLADGVGTDGALLEDSTGLVVLAMGKHGAGELNYSSDIDLVVFYDAARFPFAKRGDPRGAAVDIVRGMVKLLADTTADGYVFRVDLRLRPDAGATQVAISLDAAEDYYEAMGQNWERAAMIKARPAAGDPKAGAAFLAMITPFIWRRNLDFAAIEDIHSIKRQIHAHGGHGTVAVAGHNIKLGRGGIREIEFFTQTQQLILGGRYPALRVNRTLEGLDLLARDLVITFQAAQEMRAAYLYLRTLEHRLQMIEDQQTHTVPSSDEGIAHIACFMGYDSAEAFRAGLRAVLEQVEGHYARLFERGEELADSHGNLVFTGVDDDPETLDTIRAMGFSDPAHIAGAIRGWHHGRIRAMRSQRARELLTKLTPLILKALAATAGPDAAFAQFDRFLSGLPSGVQLFSLFQAQPRFLGLLARVLGSAPRLSGQLARNPATLDALLDADFLRVLPSRATLAERFDDMARGSYEDVLDGARRFVREENFRVGVQIVEGAARADAAGPALASIAETVIAGFLPQVEGALAQSHGRIPGGAFSVIAMGKLGGREMTASSDLDLVFVYDTPPGVEGSDGPKPLSPTIYYARVAQRLIAALTTTTGAGTLYEVDMRLRPTGNKGPAAVSLESFSRYHASEAWTWEHLALTRARLVAGPHGLQTRVTEEICRRLTKPSDGQKIIADARDMRARIAQTFADTQMWDLKYAKGGLIDIEFIAQALQLVHAPQVPEVLNTNTIAALYNLRAAGFLTGDDTGTLVASAQLQHALTQVQRIALDETLKAQTASQGLKSLLVQAGGASDFAAVEKRLATLQAETRAILQRLLG